MSRLEIGLPEKFIFCTQIPIRIGDINRASHLGHVNLVQIVEEARAQFWIDLGYKEEVDFKNGKGFIIGDLGVIFKGQAYYGQVLKIEIGAADVREKSYDLKYRVTECAGGAEIARAKTTILMFDFLLQKVIPLPEELKNKLAGG